MVLPIALTSLMSQLPAAVNLAARLSFTGSQTNTSMTVRTGTIRRTTGISIHGDPAHGTFIDDQATIGAIIGAMPLIPVQLVAILIGGCGM